MNVLNEGELINSKGYLTVGELYLSRRKNQLPTHNAYLVDARVRVDAVGASIILWVYIYLSLVYQMNFPAGTVLGFLLSLSVISYTQYQRTLVKESETSYSSLRGISFSQGTDIGLFHDGTIYS